MAIDPALGPAIVREATRLGIDPVALATAIGYETVGTYSTDIRGGAGNHYYGLIQFGPAEQRKYGIVPGMSADEQMAQVGNYLRDRGLQPGSGLLDVYSTINAGSPGHYGARDASGMSVRQHVAAMQGRYGEQAAQLVAGIAPSTGGASSEMAAFTDPPNYDFAGQGAINSLIGSDRSTPPAMPTAQVGGGQPLSPDVHAMFFSPAAQAVQPHVTAPMSYAPAALSAIQPYSTQPPPLPPAAGGPAMAGYTPPPAAALPVAPSDQLSYSQMIQSGVPGDPSQMPAAPPPVADVAGSGGTGSLLGNIVQGVKHLVQTAVPGGLHMPQSFANAGMMSGITGFGGGPLPGGVTDRASGASWLGQQAWHPASLFNSSGGINPSGGSSYNYFSPSSPGGIGGYVSHTGQLFTYPTDPDIYHSVAS